MQKEELKKIIDGDDKEIINMLMGEDEMNPELNQKDQVVEKKNVKIIDQKVITESGKLLLKD